MRFPRARVPDHLLERRFVREPVHLTRVDDFDARARQSSFRLVERLVQNFLLRFTHGDERDAVSVIQHRERQGDARRRRFRRVAQVRDPAVHFLQQFVTREQRAGVTVGAVI